MVTTPPDLPIDGAKAKESKFLGQKFLRLCKSINSLFVSWKQITWQPLSFILLIIIGHFSGSLVPLTFQLRTFQNTQNLPDLGLHQILGPVKILWGEQLGSEEISPLGWNSN
jgi:hypothetical protein